MALLSVIRHGGKKEAWLPRYCCRSVLLPFQSLGFKLNFYSMGADLNSPSGLPAGLNGETFFFIHYFGKKNRPVLGYLEEMKKKCFFFVVEDCVQALLSSPGIHDFAVYSFRKFFPQPDGALLVSDYPLAEDVPGPADESFVSRRLIGKLIRRCSDSEIFLDYFARARAIIDNFSGPRQMSVLSRFLLDRTDAGDIAAKRKKNFSYLLESLKLQAYDGALIHPLFGALDPEETPLGLPVVVDPAYRDGLRDFLAARRIYCPVHWPLTINDGALWKEESVLSRSLLTLPVDQRLEKPAMDFLIEKISDFFAAL